MLEKRLKNYKPYDFSTACSFYLGAIIITLIVQGVAGIVSSAMSSSVPDIVDNGDFNTAFMIVFQIANAGFIVLYSYIKKSKFSFTYIRERETGKSLNAACFVIPVIAGGVLMAAMYLPTLWYGYLTEAMGIPPDSGNIELSTPSSVAMIVIASVLLAPIFEETIYRGVLFHGLNEEYSTLKAVLLSSLAFTLMHMSSLQVVFQFALGVSSAYLASKSGRLLPSVILHATANALALVMQMTPFADILFGCQTWLTENIAAAVFITLGLFLAGFAVLFFGIDLAFGGKTVKSLSGKNRKNTETEKGFSDGGEKPEKSGGEKAVVTDVATVRDEAMRIVRKKEGRFKYWIAIGISVVMFVINLVSGILST